jgi:pyruvate dehydrogenase E2 component (dihydrolipoamide acetyltransferase)
VPAGAGDEHRQRPAGTRHAASSGHHLARHADLDVATDSSAQRRPAGLRWATGGLMSRSKQSIPHYYLSTTIDLRRLNGWIQQVNAGRPSAIRIVAAALLLKATALAARDVPEMNGYWTDGDFFPSASVHLGVAVPLGTGGCVTPALHDADTLSLDELTVRLSRLTASSDQSQGREPSDATITVTNLGDLGVESVFGVIYPPQVALVGFGRLREEPFAEGGLVGIRQAVTATLSADHRVSDPSRGGQFLYRIGELLQQPEEL